jgi:hypothetical protein
MIIENGFDGISSVLFSDLPRFALDRAPTTTRSSDSRFWL